MSLLDRFLKHKGWVKCNDGTPLAPFLPYFMADCIQLTYEEHIKGKLKQKEKYHGKAMMDAYHHFIHDFFNAFSRDESDEVIELMDAFSEYIHNDLEILRMTVQQPVMAMPHDKRTVFSAIVVCRLLSSHAEFIWSHIYRDTIGRAIPNLYISAMAHHAKELFREYSRYTPKECEHTDLSAYPGVKQSCNNVVTRVLEFIKIQQER